MESHFNLTDPEFVRQFREGIFPPELFSHEAHLRLAWIHLRRSGLEKATEEICQQIQQYVKIVGAEDKYHHTLTVAAVKTVYHFMQKSSSDQFPDFISDFPQLLSRFKNLLAAHYSFDIFTSERAKRHFIEPDISDFS